MTLSEIKQYIEQHNCTINLPHTDTKLWLDLTGNTVVITDGSKQLPLSEKLAREIPSITS